MTRLCISEKIGDVTCADGSRGVAYRALRDLMCSGCGAIIKTSELFTRWAHAGATGERFDNQAQDVPRLVARCIECVPFAVEIEANDDAPFVEVEIRGDESESARRNRSSLLDHLLIAGAHESKRGKPDDKHAADSKVSISPKPHAPVSQETTPAEEVYMRLAPALQRRRLYAKHNFNPRRRGK